MRCRLKRRSRYQWAGLLSFEKPMDQDADSITRGGSQHGSRVRREWLRSSKSSRQSCNTGSIIARVRSAFGSGRLCRAITNTMLYPVTRASCASSAPRMPIVAQRLSSSQSARADRLGSSQAPAGPVDSTTSCSASLSRQTLRRHSSSVRAVCVNAHVRICAGGGQRWSSLPRQLNGFR